MKLEKKLLLFWFIFLLFSSFYLFKNNPVFAQAGTCAQYELVNKWGSEGSGDGQFDKAVDVAVGNYGDVYVAEASNNKRVQVFRPDGSFLTKWGSGGNEPGQFRSPSSIAIDAQERVYVGDMLDGRLQVFSPGGSYLHRVELPGGTTPDVDGIAIDSQGNIYVADGYNDKIIKAGPDRVILKTWGSRGSGNGQFESPQDVAVDSSGNVYVADFFNHRIQKFTSEGEFLGSFGSLGRGDGQMDRPMSIAIDSNGDIFVFEHGNSRIQKFSPDGRFITKWGSADQFSHFTKINVDRSGNVYSADYYHPWIQKFGCVEGIPTPTPACQVTGSACGTATQTSIDISNITYVNPQGTMAIFRGIAEIYDGIFKSSHGDSGLSCNTQYYYDIACNIGGSHVGYAPRLWCWTVACPSPIPTSTPTVTPTPGSPTPTPFPCPDGYLGNLNCDATGLINHDDVVILLNNWNTSGPVPTPPVGQQSADLTENNKVDEADLSILLGNWRTIPITPITSSLSSVSFSPASISNQFRRNLQRLFSLLPPDRQLK